MRAPRLAAAVTAFSLGFLAPALGQEAGPPPFAAAGDVEAAVTWAPENEGSILYGSPGFREVSASSAIHGTLSFSKAYTTLGLLDFAFADSDLLSHADGAALESLSFRVNQLYADINLGDLLFLRAGKQRLKWGAGWVFNPSDVVNPPKDPTAARQTGEGVPAIKAEVITPVLSAGAFGVLYDRLEHFGAGGRVSTSAVPAADLSLSGYWSQTDSWTAALNASIAPLYAVPGWDTLLVWFEGGLYGGSRYAACREAAATPGAVEPVRAEGRHYALLAGASATLPSTRTIVLAEYYRLSEGLSRSEEAAVFASLRSPNQAVRDASAGWYAELARRPGRLGADYAFLSLAQPAITDNGHPVFDHIGLAATCLLNLADLSFLARHGLSLSFVEDSAVDLAFFWAAGGRESEFGNLPSRLGAELKVRVYF